MTAQREDERQRGDASHWRGGWLGFYVNAQDPRLWVPKKRPGIGWTLNLGHRHARVVLALLAALVLAALAAAVVLDG
jgi:uncharacterized membrane protein